MTLGSNFCSNLDHPNCSETFCFIPVHPRDSCYFDLLSLREYVLRKSIRTAWLICASNLGIKGRLSQIGRMSAQAAFYQSDPSLDSLIASEPLYLGKNFFPEFISLSLLEKGQHEDMEMPFFSNQTGSMEAMAPNMQSEDNDISLPRLHNGALRRASRDSLTESNDTKTNRAPPFLHSYQSAPSFSSASVSRCCTTSHDTELSFNTNRGSPPLYMSSNKSLSPLRCQKTGKDKRARNLERNRAAASKSRQKKKRETTELQSRFQTVNHKRSSLANEIKTLHRQLLSLKDQILLHSRCEDEAIHLYLSGMIKQATKRDSISSTAESDIGDAHSTIARYHRHTSSNGHNLSGIHDEP